MADVSRETPASPNPERVAALFRHGDKAIYQYVDLLSTTAVERGLIGPRETARVWDRHIFNSAVIAPAIPDHARVADIGSGAGLPGLVLAIARPDLSVTLVEPLLRRCAFLSEAVQLLHLTNTVVLRARAEDVDDQFDAVTARAVAPLPRLLGWGLPLCRAGGQLLAIKGSAAEEELAAAGMELTRWGARSAGIEEFGVGQLEQPTRVVRIESSGQRVIGRT
ncbi:MAG: 16S rRNA (guanine(527)-N(7))-methyltransferase RsmG [Nocardioidaceae bacterium]